MAAVLLEEYTRGMGPCYQFIEYADFAAGLQIARENPLDQLSTYNKIVQFCVTDATSWRQIMQILAVWRRGYVEMLLFNRKQWPQFIRQDLVDYFDYSNEIHHDAAKSKNSDIFRYADPRYIFPVDAQIVKRAHGSKYIGY